MAKSDNTIFLLGGAGALAVFLFMRNGKVTAGQLDNILQWYGIAKKHADDNGVSVALVLAIIWQESSGNPQAPHSSGEVGLMGLKDIAVQDVGYIQASPGPDTNVKQGTEFFAYLRSLVKDEFTALRAFKETGSNVSRLSDQSLGASYARQVQAKKQRLAKELDLLSTGQKYAIASNFGIAGMVQQAGESITDFFDGFFN